MEAICSHHFKLVKSTQSNVNTFSVEYTFDPQFASTKEKGHASNGGVFPYKMCSE